MDEEGEDGRMRSLSLMGLNNNNTSSSMANRGPGMRFKMFSPRVGTPIYRAPEILHRGQMYSESIDLWAAGCCIYFMLVGKTPFQEVTE